MNLMEFTPKADEHKKPFTTNLYEDELKDLKKLADIYGCNSASLVRQLIKHFIGCNQDKLKG